MKLADYSKRLRGMGRRPKKSRDTLRGVDVIAALHLLVTVDEIAAFHLLPTVDEIAALHHLVATLQLRVTSKSGGSPPAPNHARQPLLTAGVRARFPPPGMRNRLGRPERKARVGPYKTPRTLVRGLSPRLQNMSAVARTARPRP